MRATRLLLGGGRHFLAPKAVWSPASGWWGSSSAGGDEKRATLIGAGLAVAMLSVTYTISLRSMRRPVAVNYPTFEDPHNSGAH